MLLKKGLPFESSRHKQKRFDYQSLFNKISNKISKVCFCVILKKEDDNYEASKVINKELRRHQIIARIGFKPDFPFKMHNLVVPAYS